jgi:hypothetical protein
MAELTESEKRLRSRLTRAMGKYNQYNLHATSPKVVEELVLAVKGWLEVEAKDSQISIAGHTAIQFLANKLAPRESEELQRVTRSAYEAFVEIRHLRLDHKGGAMCCDQCTATVQNALQIRPSY